MNSTQREAGFWAPDRGGAVRCNLCAHNCRIKPGRPGICGVRWNDAGTLKTGIHGRLVSANVDPIEKKPLSHYHPGSQSLSVATVGCNMRCLFCQNASISQWPFDPAQSPPGNQVEAAELVETAIRTRCRSISFTYTEPTLGLEYASEVGAIAARQGIGSVFVTNGFLSSGSAAAAATFLEAANVDLKSMRERTYRRVSRARLAPVLRTLEDWVAAGIWVEVTTLVVPGLNDGSAELRDIARFIAGLGANVPWHISAFHPTYLMTDRPRTPVSTLRRAHEIGREEGVNHVYVGNVWGAAGESTFCAGCERRLIHRHGYSLLDVDLDGDRCPGCGEVLAGVGIGG